MSNNLMIIKLIFIICLMLSFTIATLADDINYFTLPEPIISNINGSTKLVQISLSLTSDYEPKVFDNVKLHMLPIKAAILDVIYQSTLKDLSVENRDKLCDKLLEVINKVLENKTRFGGIKQVLITDINIR